MKIVIATSRGPGKNFKEICDYIRSQSESMNVTIPPGILWTNGPGCSNLAMELVGDDDDCEKVANKITMALQPAKWGTTSDDLPKEDTNELENKS